MTAIQHALLFTSPISQVTSGIRREKTDRELIQFNEIQGEIRRVKEENKRE